MGRIANGHIVRWLLAAMLAVLLACAFATGAWAEEEASAEGEVGTETEAEAETEEAVNADNVINTRQTPDNSFLYDTNIFELNQADSSYQDTTVQVTGEVVGDCLVAEEDPGKRWITVDGVGDDEGSMSVLISQRDAALIDTYGGYGRTGTILIIRGTFYLSCPYHEGVTDIHAEQVSVMEPGRETPDEFDLAAFAPGALLCAIGGVIALLFFRLRERER